MYVMFMLCTRQTRLTESACLDDDVVGDVEGDNDGGDVGKY